MKRELRSLLIRAKAVEDYMAELEHKYGITICTTANLHREIHVGGGIQKLIRFATTEPEIVERVNSSAYPWMIKFDIGEHHLFQLEGSEQRCKDLIKEGKGE